MIEEGCDRAKRAEERMHQFIAEKLKRNVEEEKHEEGNIAKKTRIE